MHFYSVRVVFQSQGAGRCRQPASRVRRGRAKPLRIRRLPDPAHSTTLLRLPVSVI